MSVTTTTDDEPAVMHGPSRERWLAHSDFCRRQSVVWSEFAQSERNPERKARFERDAQRNFETALFAMKQALSMEDEES